MRKILASALAAVTFGGALAATAGPAQAEHYYYGHRHHDGSDRAAVAVAAGIAGLALGAALSSRGSDRDDRYYDRPYRGSYYYRNGYAYDGYDRGGYYNRPYAYDDGYSYRPNVCVTRDRVWDPYIGRPVYIERRYAC